VVRMLPLGSTRNKKSRGKIRAHDSRVIISSACSSFVHVFLSGKQCVVKGHQRLALPSLPSLRSHDHRAEGKVGQTCAFFPFFLVPNLKIQTFKYSSIYACLL
jgi:hypothetical protein